MYGTIFMVLDDVGNFLIVPQVQYLVTLGQSSRPIYCCVGLPRLSFTKSNGSAILVEDKVSSYQGRFHTRISLNPFFQMK